MTFIYKAPVALSVLGVGYFTRLSNKMASNQTSDISAAAKLLARHYYQTFYSRRVKLSIRKANYLHPGHFWYLQDSGGGNKRNK